METMEFKGWDESQTVKINMVEIHPQATSEETASVCKSYPYGRLRCVKKYWIETTKNGQRLVTRTQNPKTMVWNKPKKSAYNQIKRLYTNEIGHFKTVSLDYNNKEDKINSFINIFSSSLTSEEVEQIKKMVAYDRGMKHITWKVQPANETREEEEDTFVTINKVCSYEYNKLGCKQ